MQAGLSRVSAERRMQDAGDSTGRDSVRPGMGLRIQVLCSGPRQAGRYTAAGGWKDFR